MAYNCCLKKRIRIRSFCENFIHIQKSIFGGFGTFGKVVDFGLVC